MEIKTNLKITFKTLLIFFVSVFFAFENISASEFDFEQTLKWKKDDNAFEYVVEIKKDDFDEVIKEISTSDNYITFSLPSGNYLYRIIAFDFLGRKSTLTEWKSFSITKAVKPDIKVVENNVTVNKKNKDGIILPVQVENIEKDSQIELVNTETDEKIIIKKSGNENTENFSLQVKRNEVKPGKYKVVITNPSGLSDVSDEIIIEEEKIEKIKKPISWPIDLNILAGADFPMLLENQLNDIYPDKNFKIAPSVKINYLPFDLGMLNFGFDLSASACSFDFKEDVVNIHMMMYLGTFNLMARVNLFNNKFGICVKGGAGAALLSKDVKISETSMSDKDKLYGYVCVQGNISFQFIPLKHLILEAGADYTYVFVPDMKTQLLSPYVCIGLRL